MKWVYVSNSVEIYIHEYLETVMKKENTIVPMMASSSNVFLPYNQKTFGNSKKKRQRL
jgi:hypothetical protein